MNSIQACFIIGLVLGLLISGFVVYKIEEDRILVMENEQQKAVMEAQNKVIEKQLEGETITQKVSQEYEKKIAALSNSATSDKLPASSKHGVRKIPQSAAGTNDSCKAIKIQLNSLQEWITEQIASFNK